MEWCLLTEQCVAFNSAGELKNSLLPRHKWSTGGTGGLYVAGKKWEGRERVKCMEGEGEG